MLYCCMCAWCTEEVLYCPQELFAAAISQWRKDLMRSTLKGVKKAVDDSDRARKAAIVRKVQITAVCGAILFISSWGGALLRMCPAGLF